MKAHLIGGLCSCEDCTWDTAEHSANTTKRRTFLVSRSIINIRYHVVLAISSATHDVQTLQN